MNIDHHPEFSDPAFDPGTGEDERPRCCKCGQPCEEGITADAGKTWMHLDCFRRVRIKGLA